MTWHLWPGVVLLLQGYMVVVGSGFLSASATAMFFCASESPARRPCAHRPSLRLAPHRPRRLQDLGRRLRKSAHRALHRSVAPPLTAQPAHTLQRKTAQIPSPAKPSPRTISSTSRPVRAAFPAVLPQADLTFKNLPPFLPAPLTRHPSPPSSPPCSPSMTPSCSSHSKSKRLSKALGAFTRSTDRGII